MYKRLFMFICLPSRSNRYREWANRFWKKATAVVNQLFKIADSKIEEIKTLLYLLENAKLDDEKRFLKALIHSNKVMVEDIMREAGYMLPQSSNTNQLLNYFLQQENDLDKEIIKKLISKLEVND